MVTDIPELEGAQWVCWCQDTRLFTSEKQRFRVVGVEEGEARVMGTVWGWWEAGRGEIMDTCEEARRRGRARRRRRTDIGR